jgi:hypothetical protein
MFTVSVHNALSRPTGFPIAPDSVASRGIFHEAHEEAHSGNSILASNDTPNAEISFRSRRSSARH